MTNIRNSEAKVLGKVWGIAFLDRAPEGRYWRHALLVKFSETPCDAGKPYKGFGVLTRTVLEELGCDAAKIERLAAKKVIGIGRYEKAPAKVVAKLLAEFHKDD